MSEVTSSPPSFPHHILRGEHALAQLLPLLQARGSRIYAMGGHRALAAVMPLIDAYNSQLAEPLVIEVQWFGGEVSESLIQEQVGHARAFDADCILAIGGGKAIDSGKLVAEALEIPVATVPSIAATCAAVSAVSVLYDDKGHYLSMANLKQAPDIAVLDSGIIAKSPLRWLAAGLGDTLAKWYEFRAIADKQVDCSLNMATSVNSQLCYNIIEKYGADAIKEMEQGKAGFALEQVMDAIFLFAGFTSIMGIGDHVAAAHGLYDGFTVLDKTRDYGHGLLVGFGNLCLLALEGRNDEELLDAIRLAKNCAIPTAIDEIADLTDEEFQQAVTASVTNEDTRNMPNPVSEKDLAEAIKKVSDLSYQLSH